MRTMYDKEFFFGVALLVGTIVGVGLFSLPSVAMATNVWYMAGYFVVIGGMLQLLHSFYAEIGIRAGRKNHLPGYAGRFLGPMAKRIAFLSQSVGLYGAQLAYLIVGGSFLAQLVNVDAQAYGPFFVLLFFSAGGVLIWHSVKSVAETELVLLLLLLLFTVGFFVYGVINGTHNPVTLGSSEDPLLPYGITIFALWGLSSVPELNVLLKGKRQKINRVIITGMAISIAIYFLFLWAVMSISGPLTSNESLSGIKDLVPSGLFRLALLFGLITTFTSFLGIGIALKETYHTDYNLPPSTSWIIAMGIPLLLYSIGFDDFQEALNLSGSVGLAVSAIIIYAIYYKINPHPKRSVAQTFFSKRSVAVGLLFFTALGVILSIIDQIRTLFS